jgi:hypothetical protein
MVGPTWVCQALDGELGGCADLFEVASVGDFKGMLGALEELIDFGEWEWLEEG